MRSNRDVLKTTDELVTRERTSSGRTGIVVVILENFIQDQLGAPLHVFLGFALRGPQNVFVFKTLFKDKVGELRLYFRSCPALVATVCTIVFTAVLGQDVCWSMRKKAAVILPQV